MNIEQFKAYMKDKIIKKIIKSNYCILIDMNVDFTVDDISVLNQMAIEKNLFLSDEELNHVAIYLSGFIDGLESLKKYNLTKNVIHRLLKTYENELNEHEEQKEPLYKYR